MNNCKGENCKAVNGKGHSDECVKEHDKTVGVPDCFDRAESGGRVFDNCRFIHTCKVRKTICGNNPITQK